MVAVTGIEVRTDAADAQRRMEKFGDAVIDYGKANRQAAIQLYAWALKNYEGEGRLVGRWAPLKPRTLKQKQKLGYSSKILLRTGTMRHNFAQFSNEREAGVGNRISYSLHHQEGTARLPQRRLMPNAEEMTEIGRRVYGLHVQLAAREAFK